VSQQQQQERQQRQAQRQAHRQAQRQAAPSSAQPSGPKGADLTSLDGVWAAGLAPSPLRTVVDRAVQAVPSQPELRGLAGGAARQPPALPPLPARDRPRVAAARLYLQLRAAAALPEAWLAGLTPDLARRFVRAFGESGSAGWRRRVEVQLSQLLRQRELAEARRLMLAELRAAA
jgi:hypothetical protein